MNILYKEINRRTAEIAALPNVTIKELFEAWEHEAYKYKGELLYQGLVETAKEVQRMIDAQSQFKPKD